MLFHVGALRRLNEVGFLPAFALYSSVSGGSITAATLAARWHELAFDAAGVAQAFDRVEGALFDFAGKYVDVAAVVAGVLLPGRSIADALTLRYRRDLLGDLTLQDIPGEPRFTFNATSLQTGRLVRFSKERLATYGVGEIANPRLDLASAVAASSAFPPVLSPKLIEVAADAPWSNKGEFATPPYTTEIVTADGGVYDNLGLERADYYHTVLVSDGGARYTAKPKLGMDWLLQSKRAWETTDRQVRALRVANLIEEYRRRERYGAYWGISTDLGGYRQRGLQDPLPVSPKITGQLARVPTKLRPIERRIRYQLINWGYAVCDAAIRTDLDPSLEAPTGLPHPRYPIA
jgi:NTE family protein